MLINCRRPDLLRDAFDAGLVSGCVLEHFESIHNGRFVFATLEEAYFGSRSLEPFYLILSLCVLLYRTKCWPHRKTIIDVIQKHLVHFIHRKK